jgi:hypothetical protein
MKHILMVVAVTCLVGMEDLLAPMEGEREQQEKYPLITAIDAPRLLKDCLNLKRWTSCLDKFDEEMGMIWYMTDDPEWMEQAYGKSLPKPPSVERALGLQIFESEEKARAAFERWRAVEPEIGWRTGTTPVVGEEMLWSGGRYVIFRVDNVIVHIATPVQEDP